MSVLAPPRPQRVRRPELTAWLTMCAAAEAIGMTAAAGASRAAGALLADATPGRTALAWAAVVGAGSVEALALGLAQSRALRHHVDGLRSRRFVTATVATGALLWSAGLLPSLTSPAGGDGSAGGPPWLLVVAGGAVFGAVAGAVLGLVQAGSLPRPPARRSTWVLGSAAAWTPGMAVIMVGASTPDAGWPLATLLAWAALTGAVAGAAIGAVLAWFAVSVTGPPVSRRVVLGALRRRRADLSGRGFLGLRVTGRRSGTTYELPVMYAADGDDLWVAVGRSTTKTWWRNVGSATPVEVLRGGVWLDARADLVGPADARFPDARAGYGLRWPQARLDPLDPMVLIRTDPR